VGIIGDSLDKAGEAAFTRPIPKSAQAQINFLIKQEKGSTRRVAERLGISQRTVERYRTGQFKRPRRDLADRLAAEVKKDW
jgi:transcriptional regulator with XRE-family HTH domain